MEGCTASRVEKQNSKRRVDVPVNHHVSTSITPATVCGGSEKRMMSERFAIFIFFSRMSSFLSLQ